MADDEKSGDINLINDEDDDQVQASAQKAGKRGIKKKGLLKENCISLIYSQSNLF
jgi:hypothetical protein